MRREISWDYIHYFKESEITCKCGCGSNDISFRLMLLLDSIRCMTNEPLIITSGVRCESHNKEVCGSPTSSHLDGYAIDFKFNSEKHKVKVLEALEELNIVRCGIADTWIHIDVDPNKDPAVWYY